MKIEIADTRPRGAVCSICGAEPDVSNRKLAYHNLVSKTGEIVKHFFHLDCLKARVEKDPTCPKCHEVIDLTDIFTSDEMEKRFDSQESQEAKFSEQMQYNDIRYFTWGMMSLFSSYAYYNQLFDCSDVIKCQKMVLTAFSLAMVVGYFSSRHYYPEQRNFKAHLRCALHAGLVTMASFAMANTAECMIRHYIASPLILNVLEGNFFVDHYSWSNVVTKSALGAAFIHVFLAHLPQTRKNFKIHGYKISVFNFAICLLIYKYIKLPQATVVRILSYVFPFELASKYPRIFLGY